MNSKSKGNKFERETAEALSLWLTNGLEKRAIWRSDTSGGAATVWAKKKQEERYVKANAGDLRQIAEKGLYPELDKYFDTYVVECKSYKKIEFNPPFNKTLISFFEACIHEKGVTGKSSILILKANNRKILYCQEQNTHTHLDTTIFFTLYYKTLTLDVYLFEDVVNYNHDNGQSGTNN